MRVNVKVREEKKTLRKVKKQVAELSKTRAKVGYLQDREQLLIAIFNEYGAKIPVTDKVRGLFIALGMPLKKDKKFIIVPERSFLRTGYEKSEPTLLREMEKLLDDTLQGRISADQAMKRAAKKLTADVKDHMQSGSFQKNAPLTQKLKGSNNPLMDEKKLIDSLEFEVTRW
ncbi:hypothetical protein [Brevibacillus laterosporus]|uniref:hypothetical protein n=1 Tax=Brevibacillus laterosporus TaxID=1465 RepID=UPI0014449994|nr:hypothetical protein [Brevibacillus laterosporus]NKQ20503.1 hypothetical protein [Brevibacillus laterosporus]WNX32597.1 hypothetical protein RWW94_07285 [Brevibacillus laterosporus]